MEIFILFLIAVRKIPISTVFSVLFPCCHYCLLSSCTKVYSNNLHKSMHLNFGYLYAHASQWKVMPVSIISHHYLFPKFSSKFKIWNFVTPLSLSGCASSKLLNHLIFSNLYFIETKIVILILCHSGNETININSSSQIHNYYLSSDELLIGK